MKQELVIVGQSDDSLETDLRAPVRGIFQFRELNKFWAPYINFMDFESYRQAFGHLVAGDRSAELSTEQQALLATENGVFSMVFIKFTESVTPEEGLIQVQQAMNAAQLGIRMMSWREALGELADIVAILQGMLFLFVMFIFFVAIIIIMNTLSMAALECASEIGMMRAIGTQKGFISRMFLMETGQIAVVFGGAGIALGLLGVGALSAMNISVADSAYLSIIAGGNTIHASVSVIGIVTLLASLYPMRVASKITPLEAISRD